MNIALVIVCVLLDLLVVGSIAWGLLVLFQHLNRKKQRKMEAAEHIEMRNRMVFATRKSVYTDAVSQEKPTYVGSLGIGPVPLRRGEPLPRESSLDYGIIDPWDVNVDLERERLFEEDQKIFNQDLQQSMNTF